MDQESGAAGWISATAKSWGSFASSFAIVARREGQAGPTGLAVGGAISCKVEGPRGGQAAADAALDIGLLGIEQQLAGDPSDQARRVADHGARVLLRPAVLDRLGVEEDVAVGLGHLVEASTRRLASRQQHGAAGAQQDHHMGAIDQSIDCGVAAEFPRQVAGRALPGELATYLHVAQAQVVERHHHDQAPGMQTQQPPPELARGDRACHLQQDPGTRRLPWRGRVVRNAQDRRPALRRGTESEVGVVEDHEVRIGRLLGRRRAGAPGRRDGALAHGRRFGRSGSIEPEELLDSPDRLVAVALLPGEPGPDRVGVVEAGIARDDRAGGEVRTGDLDGDSFGSDRLSYLGHQAGYERGPAGLAVHLGSISGVPGNPGIGQLPRPRQIPIHQ